MSEIPFFFNYLKSGFSKNDFELISPEKFNFDDEKLLTKLNNNLFEYKPKNNISFYFINCPIENEKDLRNIHIRIFSEDKVDFYIFKKPKNKTFDYRVISAKTTFDNIKDIVLIPSEDEELLQTINKTSIETGAFWLYYKNALNDIKTTNVRNELVKVLSSFRDELKSKIKDDIFVQALIDRTLFIKFLEDRHIINSYFYGENIWYKDILTTKNPKVVNDLFSKVHRIFGNYLFEEPTIPENVLTSDVLQIIQDKIEGVKNGQLTLFDLKFDIIPIEAISQIYEIFFNEDQREKGIYYTPKILTNFIVNLTIDKLGTVIDPACGSGAFLISAYKKLLSFTDNKPIKVNEKIDFRIKLIKKYIFGIEKEEKARRLTIFALYLSILEDLTVEENKELKEFLKQNKDYRLFKENIGENIENKNTFEPNKFDTVKIDFIIGNPPWKKGYKDKFADEYYEKNKNIFSGKKELSELFLHKAKIWEKEETRYGFVVNTSNFTNEYSKFQDFFYKNFTIEKFYEVSNLKFFTASEPAIVCIYTKKKEINNTLTLNILKVNEFSKLFKTVLIIEDDNILIEQNSLIKSEEHENIPLRNYLVGGDGDFKIINYMESRRFEKFENYILKDNNEKLLIEEGITTYGEDARKKAGITNEFWNSLEKLDKKNLSNKFHYMYIKNESIENFNIQYIKRKDILPFIINSNSGFMKLDRSMYHRGRKDELFNGKRVLFTRLKSSSINAVCVEENIYSQDSIYTIKLKKTEDNELFVAILNSKLIDYYSEIQTLKRNDANYSRNNKENVLSFPIPINKNSELVEKISELSVKLTNKEVKYEEKEDDLNNLIYDLYGIGIFEKQRINDFFIKDKEIVKKQDLENYANEFSACLSNFINPETEIITDYFEEKYLVKGITVIKIYFGNKGQEYPKSQKVGKYLLLDLLKNANQDNVLSLRKRLYGENTIYIIKDNLKKSWSITKANEDAIAELNKMFKFKSQKK